ncbi:MAG: RlmE family RNA methyltransferase [Pseudomonadota bacterium]
MPKPPRRGGGKRPPKKRPATDQTTTALGERPEGRRYSGGADGEDAARDLKQRVKTARGRKLSSTIWLQRQLNDPYVAKARAAGYRSRAAFKLVELDEKAGLLKRGLRVVDLGAAPGGWCQVAAKAVGSSGKVIGIDFQEMEPIAGVELLEMDFLEDDAPDRLKAMLNGPADLVLSDMAASASGHRQTDHLKIMALCEAALDFAEDVLRPGGAFVAKVLQGGTERELQLRMKQRFDKVRHIKPPASRADSAEFYVVAQGFKL